MLPRGWRKRTVADLCALQNGNGFEPSEWSNHGLPIIRIQNLNGSRSFNYFAGTPDPRWIVEPGQLLFAWAGTRGVSFGPVKWSGERGVLNQHIFKVNPRNDVDPDWLLLALRSVTDRIESRAHGFKATLLHVKKSDIESQVVPTPPLREQTRIAEVVDVWDRSISVSEKLVEITLAHNKALARQLLVGKKRVGGAVGAWKEYRLGELFSERSETGCTALPLLSVTRENGVIMRDEVGRRDTSSDDKSDYLRVCPGDIAYNTMRMWQGVSALSSKEGIVSPAYTVITSREGVSGRFMAYLFKHPRVVHDFYRYSQGLVSDTWNLKYRHFSEIWVRIPEFGEQERIADVLDSASATIRSLERSRDLLLQQREVLMSQLLTGTRRLKLNSAAA